MKYIVYESGVYGIFTSDSKLLFLSIAKNLKNRFNSEKIMLENKQHPNQLLQEYYQEDQDLYFMVIMYCNENDMKHYRIILTQRLRPEFNERKKPEPFAPVGKLPAPAKLLFEKFTKQHVRVEAVNLFMQEQKIFESSIKTGKFIKMYKLAEAKRNWKEGGRLYYQFK